MKSWIAVLCLLCGTAAAAPWPVQVPADWTEHRDLADAQLGGLKNVPQMKNVEATIFLSPANDAQLTIATLEVTLENGSKQQIEAFDGGMTRGASQKADRHVRDSHRQEGNRYFGTSVDEVNGMRVHYERVYQVDSDDVVHLAMAVCTAPSEALTPCEDIQKTLHIDLANAASLKNDEGLAYKFGYALGGIAAAAGLIALIRRLR